MQNNSTDKLAKNFIERFNKLLSDYNGTYIELAHALGLKSKSNITKYANGSLNISLTMLSKIADFFEVSPVWLIGFTDDKNYKFK